MSEKHKAGEHLPPSHAPMAALTYPCRNPKCKNLVSTPGSYCSQCTPKQGKWCKNCEQPLSFHKSKKCPHIDSVGSITSWGPELFTPEGDDQ